LEIKSKEYNKSDVFGQIRRQLPYDLKVKNIEDEKLISEIRDYYAKKSIRVVYIIDGINYYYPSIIEINRNLYKREYDSPLLQIIQQFSDQITIFCSYYHP
jgi:hypothetical protein